MISIYMILAALTTTALGKGAVECNFSEPTEGQQCFKAMGRLLLFILPATADKEIRLKKDDERLILIGKNQRVTFHDKDYITQSGAYSAENYTNGTLNLGKATKSHSGVYTLEEFKLNGSFVKKTNVHLQIQAPVSEPVVSQVCLSPEQMKLSCTSEGDEVQFTLTLDGQSLVPNRDHSLSLSTWTTNPPSLTGGAAEPDKLRVSSVSISLHGQLTGELMCNVQNEASKGRTVLHLTSCKDFTSSFSVAIVAVIAGINTLLLVAFCLCIKKIYNKLRRPTTVAVSGGDSEIIYAKPLYKKSRRPTTVNAVAAGNSEVVYADVKVTRKVKKPQPSQLNTP